MATQETLNLSSGVRAVLRDLMGYKDKDQQREYQRLWMAKRREEFFSGKVCIECDSSDDLELDHIDPAKKVTHRIWSWSDKRRNVELAKCQVLCEKCHMRKSIVQFKNAYTIPRKCGTKKKYDQGCKCSACKNAVRIHWNEIRALNRSLGFSDNVDRRKLMDV